VAVSGDDRRAASPGAADAELVRRIRAGDRRAETELVERFSQGLDFYLLRLTGNRARSEDLRQDTLRIVLEKVRKGEVRQPERLAGFVRSTARNLEVASYRKRARRPQRERLSAVENLTDGERGPLARALAAEDRRVARRLLGALPSPRDRQVLFRVYVAEEDRDAVCASLGLSPAQLNLVLFRARQRFKALLRERGINGRGARGER